MNEDLVYVVAQVKTEEGHQPWSGDMLFVTYEWVFDEPIAYEWEDFNRLYPVADEE